MLDSILAHRGDGLERVKVAPPLLLLLIVLLDDVETALLVLLGNVDNLPRRSLLLFGSLGLRWIEGREL